MRSTQRQFAVNNMKDAEDRISPLLCQPIPKLCLPACAPAPFYDSYGNKCGAVAPSTLFASLVLVRYSTQFL
jgi:hypothetical protein